MDFIVYSRHDVLLTEIFIIPSSVYRPFSMILILMKRLTDLSMFNFFMFLSCCITLTCGYATAQMSCTENTGANHENRPPLNFSKEHHIFYFNIYLLCSKLRSPRAFFYRFYSSNTRKKRNGEWQITVKTD